MAEETEDKLFDMDLSAFDDMASILEEKETGTPAETIEETEELEKPEETEETEKVKDAPSNLEEEEKNLEETEEEEEEEEETEEEEAKGSSPITPIAKFLADEGILTNINFDEFDGTAEGLKNAVKGQIGEGIKYYLDEYMQSLPAEIHHLIENYQEGVPFDKLLQTGSDRIKYGSIDETTLSSDEKLQENVYKDFLKANTRFSDDKINKLVTLAKDTGELEEEAKAGLQRMVEMQDEIDQQAKLQYQENVKAQERKTQENLKLFKQKVHETKELIPGQPVNENLVDRIYKTVTTPVAKDAAGNPVNEIGKFRNENPLEFEYIIGHLFTVTNGFKDFTKLSSAGKKQAISELERAAEMLDYSSGGEVAPNARKKPNSKRTKNTADAIDDWLSSTNVFDFGSDKK